MMLWDVNKQSDCLKNVPHNREIKSNQKCNPEKVIGMLEIWDVMRNIETYLRYENSAQQIRSLSSAVF